MRIYYLFIAALAMSVMALIALILFLVSSAKNKKASNGGTVASEPMKAWGHAFVAALIIACLFYSSFLALKATAAAYGAYGDTYGKTETFQHIIYQIKYGHRDQSDRLPSNIDGKILIMYRYGCPDCNDTHDQMMMTLRKSGIDMNDVWFISSKSEKGEFLMKFYELEYVPSAIYQNIDDPENHTARVIYDIDEWKDPEAKYLEEELLAVIKAYKTDHAAHPDFEPPTS